MMMTFIFSCRKHNQIPIGYVTPGIKKSTCDDATIMSLMVL
jgi:hypothetical protein